jgi:CheY-like chemotaxis protein
MKFPDGPSPDTAEDVELGSAPVRILVAEDDADIREALAEALRRDGYEVIEAHNGWELLQVLATQDPQTDGTSQVDLVISDLRMPGKNGLDVLAGLRCANGSTPFILITGYSDSQIHAEARRLGAAAVLAKPFALEQLRTVMQTALA